MIEFLKTFCKQKRPATLTVAEQDLILQSRFREVLDEKLVVELTSSQGEIDVEQGTFCTALVNADKRPSVFVSVVTEFVGDAEPFPRLMLTIPDRIVAAESRKGFRVPLHPETQLQVSVSKSGMEWFPKPIDISVGGIFLEFQEASPPELIEDDEVIVKLTLAGNTTELEGFPVRHDGNRYAIFFSEVLRELRSSVGKIPTILCQIVEDLEQEYAELRLS